MKIIERGHKYELRNKVKGRQFLTFFKDLPHEPKGRHHDGVLSQEVLRAVIDRTIELNRQLPCQETLEILTHLRAALVLFEARAARRLLEKSYAVTGFCVEELPTDDRGHVLDFIE